jgi:hypothetical protein
MADLQLSGDQQAADSIPDEVSVDLRREMFPRVLEPPQYFDSLLISQGPKCAIDFHFSPANSYLTFS